MIIRNIKESLLFFLSLFAITGCIRERLDDCNNISLCFTYFADGNENVFGKYIDKVNLYVFDEGGTLIRDFVYFRTNPDDFHLFPSFRLSPGTYEVVALGNAFEHTGVAMGVHRSRSKDAFIYSPNWKKSVPVENYDRNYLGRKTVVIPSGNHVITNDTVVFYSSHINVEIEITGLPVSETGRGGISSPISIRLENVNVQTTLDNKVVEGNRGMLFPRLKYDTDERKYKTHNLACFRMDRDGVLMPELCRHELVVSDGDGEELERVNIYEFILAHSDYIDVTRQEALLPIEVKFWETDIEVRLPAWYIEDLNPNWE